MPDTVRTSVLRCLAVCLWLAGGGDARADDRPNILFIVSEDNGPELGCFGDPYASTPTLDRLAAEGVRFDRAFVPYSVCSPSRACFYTGRHVPQNGHLGLATHKFAMYEAYPTFYSLLQAAGYRTGLIGKLHINPAGAVADYVDYRAISSANFHEGGRDMKNYAAKAAAFFQGDYESADTDAPFLLTINYPDAHLPMHRQAHGLPEDPLNWDDVQTLPWVGVTSQRLREQTANYYNCLRRLDDGVALLLEELTTAGHRENTLIIYIGDHGAQFSRGKTSVYEAGLRVPLIVHWPPHTKKGLVRTELASTLDILPTMLTAAGVALPEVLTGRPLQPLLAGRDVPWRRYIYGVSTGSAPSIGYLQLSVRDERFKLISNPLKDPAMPPHLRALQNRSAVAYLGAQSHFSAGCTPEEVATAPAAVREVYDRFLNPPRWELYDLEKDPYEFTNRSDDVEYADVKQRLIAALESWQRSEVIKDPLVEFDNQLAFMQAHEDARSINYRGDKAFRWGYLDRFAAWKRGEEWPADPPAAAPAVERYPGAMGFEATDGFDLGQGFQPLKTAVTDLTGAKWIGDGGTSGIWNRADVPTQGEQAVRVGAKDGESTVQVTLPESSTHLGTIRFAHATYSHSTDADVSLQIRRAGEDAWTDIWTRHYAGQQVDWKKKPWPVVEVPMDREGRFELRFRTEGKRGILVDEFAVPEDAPATPTGSI